MQAMTDVSEMAQELMNSFVRGRDGDHGSSWIMPTQKAFRAAYDQASAAFEEASSQLEELGFEYEITC
jgi:hypothetical protein